MKMKKRYLLNFVLMQIAFSGFSQNLEKVAEIEVSENSKVFTFKLLDANMQNIQDDTNVEIDKTQKEIINKFLTIRGVESADFDLATATFTVVTQKYVTIKLPLNAKNE
ncbi:MAG: hypothetical protein ACK4K0_11935 [Flavobacteriales bacterium]